MAAQSNAQYGVAQPPHAFNAIFAETPKMGASEIQEIVNKLFKLPLNVEVVEDTILIDASTVGKNKFHNKKRQERGKKKKRQPKRCVEKKQAYSREELEALRFANLDSQKKKWAAVYGGLRPTVAAEYDGLVASPIKNYGVSTSRFYLRPNFAATGRRNRCAMKIC